MSTEWYTRLEKGHISGVSEDVLDAVARALQLDEDERTYLFDLARAARPAHRAPSRRRDVEVPPRVQWLLDSMTMSSAFVRNGRMDVVASNPLARALHAPMFDSATADKHGRANIARYIFLDPGAHHFFVDWDAAAVATAGAAARGSRARAARPGPARAQSASCPRSAPSSAAGGPRTTSASATTASSGCGTPRSASLELTYQSLDLPMANRAVHDLTIYTAEPGTTSEDRLKLLASLAATQHPGQRNRTTPLRTTPRRAQARLPRPGRLGALAES